MSGKFSHAQLSVTVFVFVSEDFCGLFGVFLGSRSGEEFIFADGFVFVGVEMLENLFGVVAGLVTFARGLFGLVAIGGERQGGAECQHTENGRDFHGWFSLI